MSVADTDTGAIRGWGCTPTGDSPAATSDEQTKLTCLPTQLRRGWRRTFLYCIIIFLMIIVFLNIGLTLWIISVLRLSVVSMFQLKASTAYLLNHHSYRLLINSIALQTGVGPIKIVKGGIQVAGQTWITDSLVASTITSQPAQPITLHSHRNFSILVSEPNQPEHAKLLISKQIHYENYRLFYT